MNLQVELHVQGCHAELYVNDIPVGRARPEMASLVRPVNQYLVEGTNELEAVIEPGRQPTRARAPARPGTSTGMSVAIRAARVPGGGAFDTDPGYTPLASEAWSGGPGRRESFPLTVRTAFDWSGGLGPRAWERAPRVTLDDRTRKEALSLIGFVRDAFAARNVDRLKRLREVVWRELAEAYPGLQVADIEQEFVHDMMSSDPWVVRPVRTEHLDLRIVGRGRLIECVDKDWAPVVITEEEADGSYFPLPMLVGRVDGQLRILK